MTSNDLVGGISAFASGDADRVTNTLMVLCAAGRHRPWGSWWLRRVATGSKGLSLWDVLASKRQRQGVPSVPWFFRSVSNLSTDRQHGHRGVSCPRVLSCSAAHFLGSETCTEGFYVFSLYLFKNQSIHFHTLSPSKWLPSGKFNVQGGGPPSYKLVISPLTKDISPIYTINHSYWSYKPT